MALNLSKKTEFSLRPDSPTAISGDGMDIRSDEQSSPSSGGGFNVQPLDLSVRTSSVTSKSGANNAEQMPLLQPCNRKKRLLPWSTSVPRSKIAPNTYDFTNGFDGDINGDDAKSSSLLFEDNPNENGAYTCRFCDSSVFQTWAAVQSHFQICHPNERPFTCPFAPLCPYATKWFCDMRVHFRRHHPEIANSPRLLYEAIQIVKDKAASNGINTGDGNGNPKPAVMPSFSDQRTLLSEAFSFSNDLLMIAAKHQSTLPNGPEQASPKAVANTTETSNLLSLPIFPSMTPSSSQSRQTASNREGTHSSNKTQHIQDSPFWAKAVCQQKRADINSVKAIKIDCRSVHKALNNHRQQQQQPPQSQQQLHAGGNGDSEAATAAGGGASKIAGAVASSMRSVPYKFQCLLCSYRTQRQTNYECHVACHENLRIYKCSACAYRSNWKWDLKKHIRQVHPINGKSADGGVAGDESRRQQPAEQVLMTGEGDSLDGEHVEGAAKILVMPLEEARRTVDTYLKQVGKSAEKFLLKCVLCPFVTKRRKLLTRHHQQTHGLKPEECCNTDEYVMALPSSPSSTDEEQILDKFES